MSQRILLVEDNPIESHEVMSFLRDAGYNVEVANDAEQGMQRLESNNFDMLLCDLHLPGENGFALCRRVKAVPCLRSLAVVLLTQYSEPLNFLRGLEAGADGFISKGQPPAKILERLHRVLLRREVSESNPLDLNRIVFLDTEFEVNAERNQLLEVLLSGFEDVVHLNEKYEEEVCARVLAQKSLRDTNARLISLNVTLEERVAQRTAELETHIEKLIAKNAELDQFVYVASHDLQEPVRKLISFSQLLTKDVDGHLNARAASDLNYITDAARRMQTLVQDLLALSRAGRSAMKRERVALDECVDVALETLSIRIAESGAHIARESLPVVVGDRTTLVQLYQNLLGNALKFVDGRVPMIALTVEYSKDCVTLGVRDNGIGIDIQYTTQIFAPFQRLHGRNAYEGTGIGLAICRTTVERHNGRIWVDPADGGGSHFRFTLPTLSKDCDPGETGDEPEGQEPVAMLAFSARLET